MRSVSLPAELGREEPPPLASNLTLLGFLMTQTVRLVVGAVDDGKLKLQMGTPASARPYLLSMFCIPFFSHGRSLDLPTPLRHPVHRKQHGPRPCRRGGRKHNECDPFHCRGSNDVFFRCPAATMQGQNCNLHHRAMGDELGAALEAAGAKAFVYGTPVISDGQGQGNEGMRYSLPSRDLIADCIELMHEGYRCDAMITLAGCDKTQPAAVMPIVRGNFIGLTLYGGSILAGTDPKTGKQCLDAASVFEAVGSVGCVCL